MAEETTFGTGGASGSTPDSRLSRAIAAVILLIVVIAAAIWFFQPKPATVPDVTGSTLEAARIAIGDAGYKVGVVTRQATDKAAAGIVTAQSPIGGSPATKVTAIDLVVADAAMGASSVGNVPSGNQPAKGNVTVPNVLGKTQDDAGKSISSSGLLVTFNFASSSSPAGTVTSQFPSAGASVAPATVIDVVLSSGLGSGTSSISGGGILVPSVLGLSQSQAASKLAASGWGASVTYAPATAAPQGVVFYQSPGAETLVSGRSTVTIWVSKGVPTYYPNPYAAPPLNK